MAETPLNDNATNAIHQTSHLPVMLDEVIDALNCQDNGVYVDGTFGRGGYSQGILNAAKNTHVIAIDRDIEAIHYGQEQLSPQYGERLSLHHSTFSALDRVCQESAKDGQVDGVVFDLGVSSPQFDEGHRGFSFQHDGPLDMRMDQSNDDLPTASTIINTYPAEEIANIIYTYGEEHNSRLIARKIVERRTEKAFESTTELAEFIKDIYPAKRKNTKIHPATKTFQGLRIYINQELNELEMALEKSLKVLKKNGRLCVVSFHSLEDRIVKQFMRQHSQGDASISRHMPQAENSDKTPILRLIHRKALQAKESELSQNPRSRSAKLRTAEMQLSFEERGDQL